MTTEFSDFIRLFFGALGILPLFLILYFIIGSELFLFFVGLALLSVLLWLVTVFPLALAIGLIYLLIKLRSTKDRSNPSYTKPAYPATKKSSWHGSNHDPGYASHENGDSGSDGCGSGCGGCSID